MQESVQDFFLEGIDNSISVQEILIKDSVKWYLINLLVDSVRADFSIIDPNQTITELYFKALEARTSNERNACLKTIGNISLIKLGIFPESIKKEIVNASFYRMIGLSAFGSVSDSSEIYKDIITSFDDMIEVLHGYKKFSDINNIPSLYEFWKITDSKFAFKRLIKLGFQFSYWNNINKEE